MRNGSLRRRTRWVARFVDRLILVLALASGVILAAVMTVLVIDVVLRATSGRPLPGTVGLSQVALALIVYLALPFTQARNYNVRVELLLSRLSRRSRGALDVVNRLIVLAVSSFVAWAAVPAALRSAAINETERGVIAIPIWPIRLALAMCAILVIVAVLRELVWPDDSSDNETDAQNDPQVRRL